MASLFLEWFQFGNEFQSPFKPVYTFMGQDVLRYYPDGFPLALNLITNPELQQWPQFGAWEVSLFHRRILHDGVLQYLNQNQVDLSPKTEIETDAFRLTSYPINLDDDLEPEWFVVIESTSLWMQSHILLDEESPNHYVLLSDNFPQFTGRYYADGYTTIWTDYDVTGDGVNEILLYNNTYLGANDNDISLNVLSWQDSSIQQLGFINPYYHSIGEQEPQFEIAEFNGDGVYDVQVSRQKAGNFDCDLQETVVYSWANNVSLEEQNIQPSTPACYIGGGTPEEKIVALQKALVDWEPTDDVNASLIALARVHLAMAQTAVGQTAEAQTTLDGLYNLPGNVAFVSLVRQAYEAAGKRPLQTCRNLLANSTELVQTEIGKYVSYEGAEPEMVNFGGLDGSLPHRPTICNLKSTVTYLVNNSSLPSDTSPVDLLAAQDIHYEFATQANLDSDPELEWVGILEPQWPTLLIFDAVDETWQPLRKIGSIDEITDFVIATKDVTGDGKDDVFGLTTGRNYCFELEAQMDYQGIQMLYTEDPVTKDNGLRFEGETFSCLKDVAMLEIEDITEDNFSTTTLIIRPPWKTLDNFPATDLALPDFIAQLQTAVLTQSDPDIASKITDLLAYLPPDEPEAQPYIEHLTYLLGYHYELSGDDETAVTTYLSLIRQAPNSPWSWLAWARLEPVE
ncbi:MAG: tetratricopeptide repeat protein [Chloroflexi bacterium]|nr:tetratricopeptide repeat protein [Chloroflexota bacterium]MBP7045604.1 tetratricopeptide repeat protein [Chloroflexota bacterium]